MKEKKIIFDNFLIKIFHDNFELCFSKSTGGFQYLKYNNITISKGRDEILFDININDGWICQKYKNEIELNNFNYNIIDGKTVFTLFYNIGHSYMFNACIAPLLNVKDIYEISDGTIKRSMNFSMNKTVDFYGMKDYEIKGILFKFPKVKIDNQEDCVINIPTERYYPDTPYLTRAKLERIGIEGENDFYFIISSPDLSPGLICISNLSKKLNFMSWSYSEKYPTFLSTDGNGMTFDVIHEMGFAKNVLEGEEVSVGSQYLKVSEGSKEKALQSINDFYKEESVLVPSDVPSWVKHSFNMCELNIGTLGGFKKAEKLLQKIKDTGFNILYLMPFTIGGYNNISYFDISKECGTGEELINFVKKAHFLGMKVLFDLLITITASESKIFKNHPDWFIKNKKGRIMPSIAWGNNSIDWSNEEFQNFIIDYSEYCLNKYDIDGFRVDAPEHKEVNWG